MVVVDGEAGLVGQQVRGPGGALRLDFLLLDDRHRHAHVVGRPLGAGGGDHDLLHVELPERIGAGRRVGDRSRRGRLGLRGGVEKGQKADEKEQKGAGTHRDSVDEPYLD